MRICDLIDLPLNESIKSTDPNDWSEAKQIEFVKQDSKNIKRIKNPSEAVQLAAVQRDGYAIEYITNPSLEVQLTAVQQNGHAIQFITNPTIPVQLAAVQRNGRAIKFITNPTIPVQLAAVQQDGGAIYWITNPTPLIQTAACFQHPDSINRINPIESTNISLMKKYRDELNDKRRAYLERIEKESLTESTKTPVVDDNSRFINNWSEAKQIEFVKQNYQNIKQIKHPSEAVQLAAVQQNGGAIYWITNPNLAVQIAAVQTHGGAIGCITNPCLEVQLAAVQANGYAIQDITNPTIPVQLAAVQQDGVAIEYITNPCLEVQLAAVQANGYAIQHITNPSIPVQLAAVQQNGLAILSITNPTPLIQTAACFQDPTAINRIDPIESTNIDLMKKYRDQLVPDRLAYLERIESEALTESILHIDRIDPGTWPSDWLEADNWSEEQKIAYVKAYPEDLGNFTNTTVSMQLVAVHQSGLAIMQIWNPLPLIQFAAFQQNPDSITWVAPEECRLPELVKKYNERVNTSELTESQIPVTQYGYWIMPDGQYVPVSYANHELVARELLNVTDFMSPNCLPELLKQGAIRVVTGYEQGSMEFEVQKESRPALRSLIRLIQDEQPDKIVADWGNSTLMGDSRTIIKRIAAYLENTSSTLIENQVTPEYGCWIMSDGSKIDVSYEQHQKLAFELFGCRNYAQMFDRGAIRVVNEHFSPVWNKLIETEVTWGQQVPTRPALRTLRNEIRKISPTLKIFFESGDAAKDTAAGYDGEVFESSVKFLRFINRLIEENPISESTKTPVVDDNSRFVNKWSEAKQIEFVKQNYKNIKRIKHPSEAVQLAAVQQDGWAIEYITNPSLEVQLAAVQQTGYAIQYITNPTILVQLAAVQTHGGAIGCITNPCLEVQLAAVQQNWQAIQLITNPTIPIQLAAVQQYSRAIQLITNPCLEVQLAAVQQDVWAIQYITNPTIPVQLAAVQRNGRAIKFITNPTIPVQLAAVQQDGGAIYWITNPTPLIQTAACFQHPDSINRINPIESTNISLMKKYRDELDAERLAYLERIESESLTESKKTVDDKLKSQHAKWRQLVNMPSATLEKFLNTKTGKDAGLKKSEATKLGIGTGHESARAILRMRSKPFSEWTETDRRWMGRQISFISRMSGNAGPLVKKDSEGRNQPTRKLISLWIWGHVPKGYPPGKFGIFR